MGLKENKSKLKKLIKSSKNIFLIGHKNIDLDALGSCIAMYNILTSLKKNCYIIIDEKDLEAGVFKVLKEIRDSYDIIKTSEISIYLDKNENKNLLIVLDTNKISLLQNKKSLIYFNKKVVIDHHETGKDTIEDALMILEENTSSTCEIVTNIMQQLNVDISPFICTLLLAGITLDTNNFTLKTTQDTFYTAYFLTAMGGNPKKVQYLLKQDINEYVEREKLLSNIEVINKIAITKGTSYLTYRKEDLAKIADTLLFFNDIEASFVIGKIDKNTIGLSARSLGNYNIIPILERLGGGGDSCNGACTFDKKTIAEVQKLLKKELRKEFKKLEKEEIEML